MQSAAYRGSFRLKHSPGITGRKLLFCQEPRPGRLCVYSYRTEHLAKKRKKKKKQKRKKKSHGGEKRKRKREVEKKIPHGQLARSSGTRVVNSSTRFSRLSAAFQLHRAFAYSRRRTIFTKGREIAAEIVAAQRYARRHLLKR